MELHSVGLRPETNANGSIMSQSSLNGRRHLDILKDCLESAKSFLDTLLAWPVTEYHLITFMDWMRLPRVVITICKLSFPSKTHFPQWDIKVAIDRVRLDLYLESFCYRMQTLRTFKPPDQKIPDFWTAMQKIMERIREWYMRKTHPSALTPSVSSRSLGTTPIGSSSLRNLQQTTAESFGFPTPADGVPVGNMHGARHESTDRTSTGACDFGASTLGSDNFVPMDFDDFDMDQFLDMEFWGGAGSYDPTIYGPGDMGF